MKNFVFPSLRHTHLGVYFISVFSFGTIVIICYGKIIVLIEKYFLLQSPTKTNLELQYFSGWKA